MEAKIVVAMLCVLAVAEDKCSSTGSQQVNFTIHSSRNETGHHHIRTELNNKTPLEQLEAGPSQTVSMFISLARHVCEEGEDLNMRTTVSIPPNKKRRSDYELFTGVGFYKLHLSPLTWGEANRKCILEGAHLAIINSDVEARAIGQLFSRAPKVIINATYSHVAAVGFHDLDTEGHYVTIFGQPLDVAGYNKWGSNQPNNGNGVHDKDSDCGGVERNGNYNDIPCNSKNAFICEQEL